MSSAISGRSRSQNSKLTRLRRESSGALLALIAASVKASLSFKLFVADDKPGFFTGGVYKGRRIRQAARLESVLPRSGLECGPCAFDLQIGQYACDVLERSGPILFTAPKFHLKNSRVAFFLRLIQVSGVTFAWNRKPLGICDLPTVPGFMAGGITDPERLEISMNKDFVPILAAIAGYVLREPFGAELIVHDPAQLLGERYSRRDSPRLLP